ncbi:hypothetical protein SSX86_011848 [Deinandra increscens subsp. villosa]|uniref:F-box domain-containing protein n=1 Tax=Deinandra increscens subsp. villosa TaxID=3103831 RepID=A0AAP0H0X7_9ASTR
MSAYIPFEIQEEIIKRVHPAKPLIRFRSVSKQWKSLIDSSEFITHHTALNHRTDTHHLLVRYYVDSDYKYVLIVDDDNSFPPHKSSLDVSPTVKLVSPGASMPGCCHGLVCLYGDDPVTRKKMIVVWNPSIRKSIGIPLPYRIYAVGFGVCSKTRDLMIVGFAGIPTRHWKADVFRLSSGSWTRVPTNLPRDPTGFSSKQVVEDDAIHWVANYRKIPRNGEYYYVYRIVSFDLTSEEFEQIELPRRLARSQGVYISKLKGSLVVLHPCTRIGNVPDIDVWKMLKNHDSTSFTKLFTVKSPVLFKIIGFRNNGQSIMEASVSERNPEPPRLKLYEPSSKEITDLEIVGDYGSWPFEMATYTESLLLLNVSASIIP